jgi:hypothetical protein
MGSPTRGRGYVPLGRRSLIVEIAPALAIHQVIDRAEIGAGCRAGHALCRAAVPASSSCIRWTWPSFDAAGKAILKDRRQGERPAQAEVLYTDIVADVTDQHAVILDRNRDASMILPGECPGRDGAGALRRRCRQRSRACRAQPHPRRLPDDRRLRPRLHVVEGG